MKGVVDFITASDIPGVNNMQPFYDGTVVEPVSLNCFTVSFRVEFVTCDLQKQEPSVVFA